MRDVRKRPGRSVAIASIALAFALVAPGLTGAPTPGGDVEPRSAVHQPSVLMVNVEDMTSVVALEDGVVLTGSAGGGVAEWTEGGNLSSIHTTLEGTTSNHIVAMDEAFGDVFAITRAPDAGLLRRRATTGIWEVGDPVAGANGPLRAISGDEGLVILDGSGSVFLREEGLDWKRPDLPSGVPNVGWSFVDREGGVLALSNGTGVLLVDTENGTWSEVPTTSINDLDLDGGHLVVAMDLHPDVYNLTSGEWLDVNVTDHMERLGTGWVWVEVQGDRFHAARKEGTVIEADLWVARSSDIDLKMPPNISTYKENEVRDCAIWANNLLLLATAYSMFFTGKDISGNWWESHDIGQPNTNDVIGVSYDVDILWLATTKGIDGLVFDSQGHPSSWLKSYPFEAPYYVTGLETAVDEAVVHFAGLGPQVYTYDTYASDKPSRWGIIDPYTGPGKPILDIVAAGGDLFIANDDGLHLLVPGDDTIEKVSGSPEDVLSLHALGTTIYVGTREGLWSYEVLGKTWREPGDLWQQLPPGPVNDVQYSAGRRYVAIEGTLYWSEGHSMSSSKALSTTDDIGSIAARSDRPGPVWSVVNGSVLACVPSEDHEVHGPSWEGLGDAIVRDVEVGPDGTAYLATDSGLHRVGQYSTEWSDFSTSNGLSANDVRDLELEPGGDLLWVAAYGGVDVMDTSTYRTTRIGMDEGIPSNQVYDVRIHREDVWLGTDEGGGARRDLDGTDWQAYNTSTGLVDDDVEAIGLSGDKVLFGTHNGVTVLDLQEGTFSTHTSSSTARKLPGDWVWCVLEDGNGILVGTDRGLGWYRVDGDTWTEVTVTGIEDTPVRSLAWDEDDRLWVGTDGGIVVLDSPWSMFHVGERIDHTGGLPGDVVLALMPGSGGWMWAGTSAGAAMVGMDGSVHATFTTRDGLVHDRVTSLAERPDGTIWLGTAGGLSRLERSLWELRPQSAKVTSDIPDVYVALEGVKVTPEEPSVGDEVLINVTAFNPSGKRAIVTIALFEDLGGERGAELAREIAYTEPGGSYNVSLTWVAEGGDRSFMVVADPDGVVPEVNERNNVAALSIHVNRPPTLRDGSYHVTDVLRSSHREMAFNTTFDVVYSDPDGDAPAEVYVVFPSGVDRPLHRVVGGGSLTEGALYKGRLLHPYRNVTVEFWASDGSRKASLPLDIIIGFGVSVTGIDDGAELEGDEGFSVEVLEWYGPSKSYDVELFRVEVDADPKSETDWNEREKLDLRDLGGMGFALDGVTLPAGHHDLWVVVTDDRGYWTVHVIDDVSMASEVRTGTIWPLFIALAAVVVLVILFFASRSRGDGR